MLRTLVKTNVSCFKRMKPLGILRNFNKVRVKQSIVDKKLIFGQNEKLPLFSNNPKTVFTFYYLERLYCTEANNIKQGHNNIVAGNKHTSPLDFKRDENKLKTTLEKLNEEHIHKLFPVPKSVLHNAFDILSKEFKDDKLKLHPVYNVIREKKGNKTTWVCSYNLKWPENIKFSQGGKTKQEASHKAALAALLWLKNNEKINKYGQPITVDKEQLKTIRNKLEVLSLDNFSEEKIKEILKEFNEIRTLLSFEQNQRDENVVKDPKVERDFKIKQRNFALNQYLAKEKVVLPVSQYKEDFIKLLQGNNVIIVKGEPGCGKSTRIPQYVLESWVREGGFENEENCRIVVTQPRRIAAVSLAETVSNERNEEVGKIVGYQVRLKSRFNQSTGKILYCTTGILLRHYQSDPELKEFTHLILDEAHERDVNTDLLINLLKKSQKLNPKLKIIIMSATMDTKLFQNFFPNAVLMHIPGFSYPVKNYYLDDLKLNLNRTKKMLDLPTPSVIHDDVVRVINYIHKNKPEGAILCFLPGWDDISRVKKLIPQNRDLCVYCLHSRLQDSEQHQIFSKPPPGIRKIILATNIAETSVTVNDVVYVVDSGVHKENRFDNDRGVNCMDNYWISKSSMKQRKGRAGRVQPGESFHLYTKEKYEEFPEFTIPEMLRISLTKIILDTKVYSNNMKAFEFMNELPNPPEEQSIERAVNELKDLELLDNNENLTPLGRVLSNFQLEPKFSKALVNSVVFKCCTPIVDIITLFSSSIELFISGLYDKENVKNIKMKYCKNSDHLALMRLFEEWLECIEEDDRAQANRICLNYNLVPFKLGTVKQLRGLHFDYLYDGLSKNIPIRDDFSNNDELVKSVLLSGVGTLLQHRNWDVVKGRLKHGSVFITNKNHKATITAESVNHKRAQYESNFLVYLNEIRSNLRRTTLVRESSMVSPLGVLLFLNKPLKIERVALDGDQVRLKLEGTKIEFLCDLSTGNDIVQCKEALRAIYQYYINQLTQNVETDEIIKSKWDRILEKLNELLLRNSV